MPKVHPLDADSLQRGIRFLRRADADLDRLVQEHGPPPVWARRPGFATLVRIILEQQVSLSSAQSAYRRLQTTVGSVTAANVLSAGEKRLRAAGITRQKSRYISELAERIDSGTLDLRGLGEKDAEVIRSELQQVKGIGRWTTDVYLLMALRHPDVWPFGDIALIRALHVAKRCRDVPSEDVQRRITASWAPWRSVAARILWHFYLQALR